MEEQNIEEEVCKLRVKKLNEWKISKLADLADREATANENYEAELKKLKEYKEEVNNRTFLRSEEGSQCYYN